MILTLTLFKEINRLIFVILTTGLLLISTAYANIGQVSEHKGNGAVKRTSGDKLETKESLEVFSYDEVSTGQGRTSINFIDNTRVEITEHSKLVIDEFVFDPANNKGELSMTAALGTVRYASGQIAKNYRENVKIKTPTATVSVRGTDFAMIVDEIGGSTIILLPSCDTDGNCLVGEIAVESDAGQVIMNQAFQATRVEAPESKPAKPLTALIDESMISNLLILSPPKYDEAEVAQSEAEKTADILGIDFLKIEVLNMDLLAQSEDQWFTELDIDYLAQDFLADVLDQINKVLAESFLSELTDVFVKKKQKTGQDETTGIIITDTGTNWIFQRESSQNFVRLKLSKMNQYSINLEQDDFVTQDYIVGDGGLSNIDINQR
jgi:hypothetical protein